MRGSSLSICQAEWVGVIIMTLNKKKQTERTRKRLGFTNAMALLLIILLAAGLTGGFVLAVMSIRHQYTGALACYTVVFTPIGTAISIVLAHIVDKSKAENSGPNGEGIVFAAAKASGFSQDYYSENSPPI